MLFEGVMCYGFCEDMTSNSTEQKGGGGTRKAAPMHCPVFRAFMIIDALPGEEGSKGVSETVSKTRYLVSEAVRVRVRAGSGQ